MIKNLHFSVRHRQSFMISLSPSLKHLPHARHAVALVFLLSLWSAGCASPSKARSSFQSAQRATSQTKTGGPQPLAISARPVVVEGERCLEFQVQNILPRRFSLFNDFPWNSISGLTLIGIRQDGTHLPQTYPVSDSLGGQVVLKPGEKRHGTFPISELLSVRDEATPIMVVWFLRYIDYNGRVDDAPYIASGCVVFDIKQGAQ